MSAVTAKEVRRAPGGEAAGGGVMEVDEAPPGHLAHEKIQFVNIGRISQGARPHC